jgi:hypothetical protein
MYANNELLFPPSAVPQVRHVRGEIWRALVDRINLLPQEHPESLAFSLMMIRLNGCLGCETDSYRAMRGCIPCARQTLRRYKGSDDDLMQRYEAALTDVYTYLQSHPDLVLVEVFAPAQAA